MDIYVTTQGDCWDSLAYELYGDEKYMQLLIEANDMPDEEDEDSPFWRQEDDEDDEEYYSSVDEPDEEDEDE